MSTIVGLDPSPLRLGYAILDEDTFTVVAMGVCNIAEPGLGWLETQVARAFTIIKEQAGWVTHWFREEPMARGIGAAKEHGYVCATVDAAARVVWPDAITLEAAPVGRESSGRHIVGVKPAEWRIAAGLSGGASKAVCAVRAAELAGDPAVGVSQDAADAYLVARAGYLLVHPDLRLTSQLASVADTGIESDEVGHD